MLCLKAANEKHKPQKAITCFALIFTLTYVPQLKIITQLNNVRPGHAHKNKNHSQYIPNRENVCLGNAKVNEVYSIFSKHSTKGQNTFVTK